MDADTAVFMWRMVLLSMSSFLIGATLVISMRYYRAWRKRGVNTWKGMLPLHVFTVTLSYNFLLAYSTAEMLIRIEDDNDNAVWRGLLLGPAFLFGFIAMRSISKFRRIARLKESQNIG